MLPSRLFRNTGIPPALRSLITPHASLPSTVAVQLRFRLGVIPGSMPSISSAAALVPKAASLSTSTPKATPPPSTSEKEEPKVRLSEPSSEASSSSPPSTGPPQTTTSQTLPEKLEPKLSLTFTCTVQDCGERSTHQFTKQAYEKGIVLVQCPKCKNRHLIADHLGWFKEGTQDGKLRTVEALVRAKGEKVQRGTISADGDVEYVE